jgi:hypothetical protein
MTNHLKYLSDCYRGHRYQSRWISLEFKRAAIRADERADQSTGEQPH